MQNLCYQNLAQVLHVTTVAFLDVCFPQQTFL